MAIIKSAKSSMPNAARVTSPSDVVETLNHLLTTGDRFPLLGVVSELSEYALDVLGPREFVKGAEAPHRARSDIEEFVASGNGFSVEFIDGTSNDNCGFWMLKLTDRDGVQRMGQLSIRLSESGLPYRIVMTSNRIVT